MPIVPTRPGDTTPRRVRRPRRPAGLVSPWLIIAVIGLFELLQQAGGLPNADTPGPPRLVWPVMDNALAIVQLGCLIWWASMYLPWRIRRRQPAGPTRPADLTFAPANRKARAVRLRAAATSPTDQTTGLILQLILGTARYVDGHQLHALHEAYTTARTKGWKRALARANNLLRDSTVPDTGALDELDELHPAAYAAALAAVTEDRLPVEDYELLTGPWAAVGLLYAGADPDGTVMIGRLAHGALSWGHVIPRNAPTPGAVVETFLTWLDIARRLPDAQRAELDMLHMEGGDPTYHDGHQRAWRTACQSGRAQAVRFLTLDLPKPLTYVGVAVLTQDLIPDRVYLRLTAGWTAAGLTLPTPLYTGARHPVGVQYEDACWCPDCAKANVPIDGEWAPLDAAAVTAGEARALCSMCERALIGLAVDPARARVS